MTLVIKSSVITTNSRNVLLPSRMRMFWKSVGEIDAEYLLAPQRDSIEWQWQSQSLRRSRSGSCRVGTMNAFPNLLNRSSEAQSDSRAPASRKFGKRVDGAYSAIAQTIPGDDLSLWIQNFACCSNQITGFCSCPIADCLCRRITSFQFSWPTTATCQLTVLVPTDST